MYGKTMTWHVTDEKMRLQNLKLLLKFEYARALRWSKHEKAAKQKTGYYANDTKTYCEHSAKSWFFFLDPELSDIQFHQSIQAKIKLWADLETNLSSSTQFTI